MVALPRLQQTLALVTSYGTPTNAFQVWWDQFAAAIVAAFAATQSQLDAITAILDPNTLTPDKKPIWMFMVSYLTGEQADLDAKATTYGITTEKTNYDNAISALTTYLATLTTPVLWNDTSGNTTINDVTFRGKFTTVLTTKQFLINKITAQAKVLADGAQTTANTANTNAATATTNAATAQSTANTVKRDDKITASTVIPANVLTATDAGTNVTITIAAHSRRYGDASSLSVAGGTLTGAAYSTVYGIYYDDTTTADTTPTYHKTTTPSNALNSFVAGRHFVGDVTTPAAAGAPTTGGYTPPDTDAVDATSRSKYDL